jgi:hypothetical protein
MIKCCEMFLLVPRPPLPSASPPWQGEKKNVSCKHDANNWAWKSGKRI